MARRSRGRPLNGWLVLDKPPGLTSTQALGAVKRVYRPAKAGHGGTLDPLATGVLPIAFGEATKTINFVLDGLKVYRFTVRWGVRTTTDDSEGEVADTTDARPDTASIEAALPGFVGEIEQVPPHYSAVKVEGERAYNLAREGEIFDLAPRVVQVHALSLIDQPDRDHARFEARCGKGTYMRSLARDLGARLGCFGHIVALRRLRVGRFDVSLAIPLDALTALSHTDDADTHILPVATALDDIPALALTEGEAHRLKLGQTIALISRQDLVRLDRLATEAPDSSAVVVAAYAGKPVALVRRDGAEIRPVRVLNL